MNGIEIEVKSDSVFSLVQEILLDHSLLVGFLCLRAVRAL